MGSFEHSAAHRVLENDPEKQVELRPVQADVDPKTATDISINPEGALPEHDIPPAPTVLKGRLARWNDAVEGLSGLEKRGIARVSLDEKHGGGTRSYVSMFALWSSMNLCALNITTGLLGPLVFELGWVDCICIVIFANAISACGAAYISTFGPESGNRTMIIGRYFMGYWPSRLVCILNIIMQVGWGIISCIIAGQILSAINGRGLSVAVGCVISALCIGVVTIFGIGLVYKFERYAFIPQVFAMLVLIGSAGKYFDTDLVSVGSPGAVTGNRLSFFALQFASAIGFSAVGADFFVYYPTTTPKLVTFSLVWMGTWLPYIVCNILGVGIGTGTLSNSGWNDAYGISSGALLFACYDGLGSFGSFCVLLLAFGSITNMSPCSYAAALDFQALGRYAKAIPRWMWCVVVMLIELVCSVAGNKSLFTIFENFIPIMSYWVAPWITIGIEEHLIFHVLRGAPFDWTAWEDKKRLPIGVAALTAWLIGWAGAIIGMSQVWFQGPIALLIGDYGADIGAWLSIGFAGLAYPPLRIWELKHFER